MHARSAPKATLYADCSSMVLALLLALWSGSATRTEQVVSVYGGRPIAEATLQLQHNHNWIITYEDPRYEHVDDLEDITDQISRVRNPPRRVLAAKARAFEFQYDLATSQEGPIDAEVILRRMLEEYAASNPSCVFRLQQQGGLFHVIPELVRNKNGELVPQRSPLDFQVSLPRKERTAQEFLLEMTAALSKASGFEVGLNAPVNLMLRTRVQLGADGEVARSVWSRMLAATGMRLTWRLFYDPGLKRYGLNITMLPESK